MPYLQNPNANQTTFSQSQLAAPYLHYEVVTDYIYNDGSLAIPVAYTTGQGQPSGQPAQEIVQVSAPISQRRVSFAIERQGALPVLPSPTVLNANENLSKVWTRVFSPKVGADGVTLTYRAIGQYIFDQRVPFFPTNGVRIPTTDADTLSPANLALNNNNFKPGLY